MAQPFATVFFRWWVETVELVPASWLNLFAKSSDAAILEIEGGNFRLWVRRDGGETLIAENVLAELRLVLEHVTDLPQLLLLRVAAEQALCKRLTLPAAARRDLKSFLGFEIDRETPFEQAEVYWNYAAGALDKARGKFDLDLVIVPRPLADQAVAAARDAGFAPAGMEVKTPAGNSVLIWISNARPVRLMVPYRKLIPLAGVTGALAATILVLAFAGQQWSLFIAERAIAGFGTRAHEASSLKDAANHRTSAIAFLSRSQGISGSALSILAAATRTLPDDTYLTSLGVHDGRVTMAGYSESAASLIGILEKSSSFREPAFNSPVTASEGSDEEKFTLSATLAPADPS